MEFVMLVFLGIVVAIAALVFWHIEIVAAAWAVWFFFVHLTLFTWIYTHPLKTVSLVAGYFLIGAAWSVAKWWFEETDNVRKAKERYASFGHSRGTMTWTEWKASTKTNPAQYKSQILFWISLWPFSAVFTLLDDPVRRICRRIYNELQGVYQRITDYVWQ